MPFPYVSNARVARAFVVAAVAAIAALAALTAGTASAKSVGQWTQADVNAGVAKGVGYLDSVADKSDPSNIHWCTSSCDYSGDVTDTGFAIAAIGAALTLDPSNVTAGQLADAKNAVQWLIKQQDTSATDTKGSWGVSHTESDSNYATSIALIALSFFSSEPNAANAISLGRTFEIHWQNAPPATTGNSSSSCTAPSGSDYGNCGSWTYHPQSSNGGGGDGSNTGFGVSGLDFSGGVPAATATANLGWARAIQELKSNPYATFNDGGGSYDPGETCCGFRSSANGSGSDLFEFAYDGVAAGDAGVQASLKFNTDVLDTYEKSQSGSRVEIFHDPPSPFGEDGSCQVGASGCDWVANTGEGGYHYSLFAISKGIGSYVAANIADPTNFYAKVVDLLLSQQVADGSWPADLRDDGSTVGATAFSILALTKAGQKAAPATASGTVYNDANGNAKRDTGEGGLGGFTVYVDTNGNGKLDAGEPSALSASDGSYTIANVTPGTYAVREAIQTAYKCTAPSGCAYANVALAGGQAATGLDFGNQKVALVPAAPARCKVPKLKHKTLKQARALLKRNHCKLGHVRRASDPRRRGKVIVTQSRKAGKLLANGSAVGVRMAVLKPPPAPKPRFTG